MALYDEPAKGVPEGERILRISVNDEGSETDSLGGGLVVDFIKRDVKDGAGGLAQIMIRDVGGDADDLVNGLIGATFKAFGRLDTGRGSRFLRRFR